MVSTNEIFKTVFALSIGSDSTLERSQASQSTTGTIANVMAALCWWDTAPIDLENQRRLNEARVKQQAYVYQNEIRGIIC